MPCMCALSSANCEWGPWAFAQDWGTSRPRYWCRSSFLVSVIYSVSTEHCLGRSARGATATTPVLTIFSISWHRLRRFRNTCHYIVYSFIHSQYKQCALMSMLVWPVGGTWTSTSARQRTQIERWSIIASRIFYKLLSASLASMCLCSCTKKFAQNGSIPRVE